MWIIYIILLSRSAERLLYYALRYESPLLISSNRATSLTSLFHESSSRLTCPLLSRYIYTELGLLTLFLEIIRDISVFSRLGASSYQSQSESDTGTPGVETCCLASNGTSYKCCTLRIASIRIGYLKRKSSDIEPREDGLPRDHANILLSYQAG